MNTAALTTYVLPVHEIVHRPGQEREFTGRVIARDGFGAGIIRVPEGSLTDLSVRLESVHEGILATGEADATAVGECSRCLNPVELPVEVEFQELFAYSIEEGFDFTVHDNQLDLEPVVRDAIVLALPFNPVCTPDCRGLDPETGERLSPDSDRTPETPIDHRWAALVGFQADDDEAEGADRGAE